VADLATRDPTNLPLRAKVIWDGLEYFPSLQALGAAMTGPRVGLTGAAAGGDTSAVLLSQGIHSWRNEHYRDLAKKYFASACQGSGTNASLVAEMALQAAFGDKPDPALATALIDSASASAPDDAAIRGIRERILSLSDQGKSAAPKR
jgi:hypothetical protein